MHKNILVHIFLVLLTGVTLSATAQTTDTSKKDSVKIDTAILNNYRVDAPKNALPVRSRTIQLKQELIPVTLLDYKISYWRKWITLGFNFSQSGFTNNYQAGGTNSIAIGGNFEYKAEYHKGTFDYVPDLQMRYAKSKNKGQAARKSDDWLWFDNKVATQMSKHWFFFGSLNFQSQFDDGYNYNYDGLNLGHDEVISKFMAPGYLTESVGFEYKPNTWFDLRIGTGTARQTFMLDTTLYHANGGSNNNVPIGKTFHNDLAFQGVTTIDKALDKRNLLKLHVLYQLFIPYQENIKFISHRIDSSLSAQVTRLFNVSLNSTFIYDRSQRPQPQGTEGLAMGVRYTFPY